LENDEKVFEMIAGINEILVEDAGVQTAVGQNAASSKYKVYPIVAPSGEALPYITTSRVSNAPNLNKDSVSSLDLQSFAVHVHSNSYDGIDDMAEAVRNALNNKRSTTEAGYLFDRIWYSNEYDRPELYNSNNPVFVRTIIFNAQVRRT
jgi:hypothetical protein